MVQNESEMAIFRRSARIDLFARFLIENELKKCMISLVNWMINDWSNWERKLTYWGSKTCQNCLKTVDPRGSIIFGRFRVKMKWKNCMISLVIDWNSFKRIEEEKPTCLCWKTGRKRLFSIGRSFLDVLDWKGNEKQLMSAVDWLK